MWRSTSGWARSVRPARRAWPRSRHPRPEDIFLLVEVSDSTVQFDRRVKRRLYGAAGIAEVWIVDIGASLIEVATQPGAEGYGRIDQVGPGGFAVPTALPDLRLPVAEVFA